MSKPRNETCVSQDKLDSITVIYNLPNPNALKRTKTSFLFIPSVLLGGVCYCLDSETRALSGILLVFFERFFLGAIYISSVYMSSVNANHRTKLDVRGAGKHHLSPRRGSRYF